MVRILISLTVGFGGEMQLSSRSLGLLVEAIVRPLGLSYNNAIVASLVAQVTAKCAMRCALYCVGSSHIGNLHDRRRTFISNLRS